MMNFIDSQTVVILTDGKSRREGKSNQKNITSVICITYFLLTTHKYDQNNKTPC